MNRFLYKYLKAYKNENIGIITLNKPETLNILCYETFAEINYALKNFESDEDIRVILLNAKFNKSKSGKKIFSAGVNLKDYEKKFELAEKNSLEFEKNLLSVRKILKSVEKCKKPVIAGVNGIAVGGSFELILNCDLVFASTNANFVLPEVNLGLIPGYGGIHKLAEIIGEKKAFYYISTAETISANQAYNMGIVSQVFDEEVFEQKLTELCKKLAGQSPNAISLLKSTFKEIKTNDVDIVESKNFIKAILHSDSKKGVNAFLNKLTPKY